MFERADWRVLGDWDRENNPSYVAWYDCVVDKKLPKDMKLTPWEVEYLKTARSRMTTGFMVRDHCISEFSFAVPDEYSLDRISAHSPHGLIEIGPGTGYWSWLLRKKGVWPILSCDVGPLKERGSRYRGGFKNEWTYVRHTPHDKTPELLNPKGMSLFMCWPDMDSWPVEALRLYTGDKLIYIGEGSGGCTADDAFFDELDKNWKEADWYYLPSWDGIHDELHFYKRDPNKRPPEAIGDRHNSHVEIVPDQVTQKSEVL
jgi:hypothetical protein